MTIGRWSTVRKESLREQEPALTGMGRQVALNAIEKKFANSSLRGGEWRQQIFT